MQILPQNVHEILKKYMLVEGYDLVLDLKKSNSFYLWDSRRNRRVLDFFTFFATAPLGCNHPKMLEPDFLKKLGAIAVNKPSNSDVYTQELAEFIETFARLAKPESMRYLFFISGGALAVENGLKTAFDWKVRKNFEKGYKEEKGFKVIHFKEAFHGRSGYTLALTNTYDPRKTKYFAKFDWPRITNPKLTFPLNKENLQKVKELEAKAIEEIDQAIETNKDDCAALIIEPIQGEGGDNHFRGEFFKVLRKICDENELIFILDEVQSGMGLTGKLWCYQHFDFEPDIICFGKKMQVCGIMASKRVDEVENNVFRESSRLNSTWGGNLVDMVRSKRYLEIIQEERLVENADLMGKYLLKELLKVGEKFPNLLSNIRGRGLMVAFDLPTPEIRDKLKEKLYELGMIILGCGTRSIRFRPPLNIEREPIDKGMEILEKALRAL
jgi:L-lysine 6-transaminase